MTSPLVSIVIPLWNEADNIDSLIALLDQSSAVCVGLAEAVLVNNGSTDATGALIDYHAVLKPWIRPIHLKENLNYGGGSRRLGVAWNNRTCTSDFKGSFN